MSSVFGLDPGIVALVGVCCLTYALYLVRKIQSEVACMHSAIHDIEVGVDTIGHILTLDRMEDYEEEPCPEVSERVEAWKAWED